MLKQFISLEWKSFKRSPSFGSGILMKILIGFAAAYFAVCFLILGAGLYFILEEMGLPPLETVNRGLVYYLVCDLAIRYFLQKMPVVNIKPLLSLPVTRNAIVHFALGKTSVSFFNWIHGFWLVPFSIVLLFHGFSPLGVIGWHIGVFALIFANGYINLLINNKDALFACVLVLLAVLGWAQYENWFDLTLYFQPVFQSLYDWPVLGLACVGIAALCYWLSFRFFKARLHLDTGLSSAQSEVKTKDLTWLARFGQMGIFIGNDLRMIARNKRSRMTVIMSGVFLFYGLLFMSGIFEGYNSPAMQMFGGIFVTGGFLMTFGQFVPSWDSAYYPLMMSQNIPYRDYIMAKWWLMVIGTVASTILAAFYLLFGWKVYAMIVAGAIFNIGVNSQLVLWGGAYVKTPIDLTSSNRAFGDKQAFNFRTFLISLPKLLVPMALYALGYYTLGEWFGIGFVAAAGIIGFGFRNAVFNKVERIYKYEKYKTLEAYKQK